MSSSRVPLQHLAGRTAKAKCGTGHSWALVSTTWGNARAHAYVDASEGSPCHQWPAASEASRTERTPRERPHTVIAAITFRWQCATRTGPQPKEAVRLPRSDARSSARPLASSSSDEIPGPRACESSARAGRLMAIPPPRRSWHSAHVVPKI